MGPISTRWQQYRILEGFSFPDFYQAHCRYAPAMLGWFLFSAVLSAYNKFVFGDGHMAFPCPLLLTSIHFACQWMFASTLCATFPQTFGNDRLQSMAWKEYLTTSLPCGIVTAGDIGLSNLSMVTLTISFYTMVKASTPIFVLGWAYIFGIERITFTLLVVVLVIALGEFLTVLGEVEFKPVGFVLCLSAALMSGARWTLVQLKLQTMEPPLKTTIATMKLLAPSMFASMLLLSILVERPWNKFDNMDFDAALRIVVLGIVGAIFAIAMILCEFHLIMYSSAIILMIGGVVKEMVTIIVGVLVFKDELNRINLAGCFVVFLGVILYKVTHHLDQKDSHKPKEPLYRTVENADPEEDYTVSNGHLDATELRHADGALGMELGTVDLRRPSVSSSHGSPPKTPRPVMV